MDPAVLGASQGHRPFGLRDELATVGAPARDDLVACEEGVVTVLDEVQRGEQWRD
ncbi:hypothetical protein [Saccharopolyspora sp. NPDC002376]